MVGDDRGMILGPPDRLEPLSDATVLLATLSAGDLPVRDVAQQHVGEAPLVLTSDRRASLADEESLARKA